MMNEPVWVSGAMMNERLMLRVTADIIVNDRSWAVEGLRRMNAGERLSEDWFPRQIWVDKNGAAKNPLPDLFYGNSYWIVSSACADVLRAFDVGNASLYPVEMLQKDRKTPIGADHYSLNICNRKQAFIGAESPDTRPFLSEEDRLLKFVHKDDGVAVSRVALDGVDIWIDPKLFRAFFVSDRLARSLKAAGVARPFGLRRCRVP